MRYRTGLRVAGAAVAGAMAVGGCAGSQTAPITCNADEGKVSGIRYYEPAKYVLMYADGKGGVKWDWLNLPDQSQLMAVDPTVFLASGDTTLEFTNGTLLKQDDTADATAVPSAVVTALEAALKAAATGFLNNPNTAMAAPGPYEIPAPRLYKVICNGGQWSLSGQYSTVPVRITLPEAK
ncbi:MAG TPA: hypothetical protein VK986_21485 [Tepidisphaeraceae bacterium]|nr:hypothetical protein [Tepidisphaeraceae bacterium]